jgi:hypothetical protein
MPFWSTNFGEDTTLKDPKRNFRFTVEFTGIQAAQGGATLWYATKVAKPSFTVSAAEHTYLNHKFFYPGAVTWNDVSVSLVDPADPDVTATLADIIIQSGYSPPTDATAQNMNSMSKAKAAGALGTVVIKQLDSNGKALETWTLWNSWISDIKFGDGLEYGNDDLTALDVTLKYDWARVETTVPSSAVVGGGNSFFNV